MAEDTHDLSTNYAGDRKNNKTYKLAVAVGGEITTAGGAAAESVTVTGVIAADDTVIASLVDDGTNNVSLLSAKATADNEITFTFSADPGADTIVAYAVLKK